VIIEPLFQSENHQKKYEALFLEIDQGRIEGVDEEIVVTEQLPGRHYVSVHDTLTQKMSFFVKYLSQSA
jgi:hypothetical protein